MKSTEILINISDAINAPSVSKIENNMLTFADKSTCLNFSSDAKFQKTLTKTILNFELRLWLNSNHNEQFEKNCRRDMLIFSMCNDVSKKEKRRHPNVCKCKNITNRQFSKTFCPFCWRSVSSNVVQQFGSFKFHDSYVFVVLGGSLRHFPSLFHFLWQKYIMVAAFATLNPV